MRPKVDLRDIVWQNVYKETIDGRGEDASAFVVDQRARWRLGLMRGSARMTMRVSVNDEDKVATFKLVKPVTATTPASATASATATAPSSSVVDTAVVDAATTAVAAASSGRASSARGNHSTMLVDYRGVIGVTYNQDGDVVVNMKGEAKVANVLGKDLLTLSVSH